VAPIEAMGPLAYHVTPPRHAGVLLVGDFIPPGALLAAAFGRKT